MRRFLNKILYKHDKLCPAAAAILNFRSTKNPQTFVEVYPLITLGKFQFNWSSGFRRDLWHFSHSEHIIGPGGHVLNSIRQNFVEIHPRNIPARFSSKWPNGFKGDDSNAYDRRRRWIPSDDNSSGQVS